MLVCNNILLGEAVNSAPIQNRSFRGEHRKKSLFESAIDNAIYNVAVELIEIQYLGII